MSDDLPTEPQAIAEYVAKVLGVTVPPQSVDGLASNYRLLLSHWAQFGTPIKGPQ